MPTLFQAGPATIYGETVNGIGHLLSIGSGTEPPPECCCCSSSVGCCCAILEGNPPPAQLLLTVVAPACPAIDGATCLLDLTELGGDCVSYRATCTIGSCPTVPIGVTWTLICNRGAGCNGFRLSMVPGSSDCSGDSTTTNKPPSFCSCDPFQVEFNGLKLVNGAGSNCDCCADFGATVTLPP